MRDVEFTLGIDVNVSKVGKDLSKAIFAEPNNMSKFADVPQLDVPVVRGMTHDGLGKYPSGMVKKAPDSTADIVKLLKDTKTDGVIIDAIRCAKIALDRKLSGPIVGPSSYFFKTPPRQFRDDICREKVEAFIEGESNE